MASISEVPRTLNQRSYSFHLDLPLIPCLPIRTEVAWDYSPTPSKRRKLISFRLIDSLNVIAALRARKPDILFSLFQEFDLRDEDVTALMAGNLRPKEKMLAGFAKS
jgi:hypothetical protein